MEFEGTRENRGTLGIFTGLFVLVVSGFCLDFWVTESAAIKPERSPSAKSSGKSRNKVEATSSPMVFTTADGQQLALNPSPQTQDISLSNESIINVDDETRQDRIEANPDDRVAPRFFKGVRDKKGIYR